MHEPVCAACLAWKESDRTGEPMVVPVEPKPADVRVRNRQVDYVKETLSNLKLVDRHLKLAPVDKVGPLSKRKSELLKELREYQAGDASPAQARKVDPLDAALSGGVSLDNVTRISA